MSTTSPDLSFNSENKYVVVWVHTLNKYSEIISNAAIFIAVTYPFDLTKTRLQIQSEVAAAKHGFKVSSFY